MKTEPLMLKSTDLVVILVLVSSAIWQRAILQRTLPNSIKANPKQKTRIKTLRDQRLQIFFLFLALADLFEFTGTFCSL
jgi:hypothetical protein